jgi:exodeoxyribonuclease V beta subunit
VDRRQSELGFDLALEGLDAAALNALLREQGGLSARAQGLEFPRLRGMFSGFIDLVFEHGGRYSVADFKSNPHGDTLDAYAGASLEQSILHHRYDLQYVLYTLALHRLLDQRLGRAYDYERHVGGAFYLFLRGIRARAGNSAGVFFARPARELILALDALFRGRK